MDFDALKKHLSTLDTACVCDANKSLGLDLRAMDPGIRTFRRGLTLVGRAHTVRCHNDFLTVIKALGDAEAGEVIVIDSQNSTKAMTGELFPSECIRKGLAGIVNDGPCRDTAVVRALDLPYFARSVTCVPGTTDLLFETQIPITCGGVEVSPGDIVFGDDDGVLVASADVFAELLPAAAAVQANEDRALAAMAAGTSLLDMLNFKEHCANVEAGRESALRFKSQEA